MFQAQHFSLGLPPHFPSPLSSPSLQGQWSCWGCWAFDWSLWSCSPAEPRVLLSGRSHTHTPETDMQRSEIGSGRGDESDKQESFIWNLFLNPNPDLSVFGLWRHHQEENIFLGNEKKIRKKHYSRNKRTCMRSTTLKKGFERVSCSLSKKMRIVIVRFCDLFQL